MIVYEMMTNKKPFSKFNEEEISHKVVQLNKRPHLNKRIPYCYKKLILSCWSENPSDRPSFNEIVDLLKRNKNFILDEFEEEFLQFVDSPYSKFNGNYSYSQSEIKISNLNDFSQSDDSDSDSNDIVSYSDSSDSSIFYDNLHLNNSDSPKIDFNEYPFINIGNFEKVEKIAEKNLVRIFKVQDKRTKKLFFAKSFIFKQYDLLNYFSVKKTVEILAQMNHPSFVKFIGYSPFNLENEPKPIIITEFPSNGSLKDIIEKERKGEHFNEWNLTRKIITIYGIATGMKYLHSHNIIHHGLCPNNILFDDDFFPRIDNLEFCIDTSNDNFSTYQENFPIQYIPPETIERNEYNKQSDVYSFSILIYTIFMNVEPFESHEDANQELYMDDNIPKPYQSLIKQCLTPNYEERPTFDTIVNILIKSNMNLINYEVEKNIISDYANSIDLAIAKSNKNSITAEFLNINNFTILDKIGYGTYGNVYKVKESISNKIYGAKESIKTIKNSSKETKENMKREFKILTKLNHPAILKYYGYSPTNFHNKKKPVIIIECGSISLSQVLRMESYSNAPKGWDLTKKLNVIYGIASGMKYLHSLNIIHRDLKPSNIILDEYLFPKISDFGLSKIMNHDNKGKNNSEVEYYGTPSYIPPETWKYHIYSKEGDVYSFGIIVYEIMIGVTPYNGYNYYQIINEVIQGYRPEFTYFIPDCYKKLIEACLSHDMYKRPSFSEKTEYLAKNDSFKEEIDVDEFENYIEYVKGPISDEISEKVFTKFEVDFQSAKKPNYLELSPTVQIINLQESFFKKEKIGSGSFGNVYRIIDKKTKEEFVAKVLKIEFNFLKEIDQINFSREVNIMSCLNHESIIKFIGFSQVNFKGKAKPTYVMEMAENDSLEKVLCLERQSYSMPEWNNTKKFINIYGIAHALKYIHSKDIIHRDLKPGNIILDKYLYPKITDFGFAKEISQQLININSNALGTPAYISPEIWKSNKHGKASDVYAFAMILFEILTNEMPFANFNNKYLQ